MFHATGGIVQLEINFLQSNEYYVKLNSACSGNIALNPFIVQRHTDD